MLKGSVFEFDDESCLAWVGVEGGRIVANTLLEVRQLRWTHGATCRAGYWMNLYVPERLRRTLLYPRLVRAMIAGAQDRGIGLIYAAVRRPAVSAAHQALGFHVIAKMDVHAKILRPSTMLFKSLGFTNRVAKGLPFIDALYRRLWLRKSATVESRTAKANWSAPVLHELIDARETETEPSVRWLTSASEYLERFAHNIDREPYEIVRSGNAFIVYRLAERDHGIRAGIIMDVVGTRQFRADVERCLSFLETRCVEDKADVIICLPGSLPSSDWSVTTRRYSALSYRYDLLRRDIANCGSLPSTDLSWRFSFADHDAF